MAKLVWVDELDTGIPEIDRQHRRIVDYINELDAVRHTHNLEDLRQVIGDLVEYTLSHFVFEETLFEDAGYTFSGPHKKVHQIFTRRVNDLQERFDLGEDVTEELHGMLARWLFNHIRNEDHCYVEVVREYLQGLQRKNNPKADRARIRAELEREMRQEKRGFLSRLFGR